MEDILRQLAEVSLCQQSFTEELVGRQERLENTFEQLRLEATMRAPLPSTHGGRQGRQGCRDAKSRVTE